MIIEPIFLILLLYLLENTVYSNYCFEPIFKYVFGPFKYVVFSLLLIFIYILAVSSDGYILLNYY